MPGGGFPTPMPAGPPPPPGGWWSNPPPPPSSLPPTGGQAPPMECRPFLGDNRPSGACPLTLNENFSSGLNGWAFFEECFQPGSCTGGYMLSILADAAVISGNAYLKAGGMPKLVPDRASPLILPFGLR